jgi:hypothetical protein
MRVIDDGFRIEETAKALFEVDDYEHYRATCSSCCAEKARWSR